MGKPENPLRSLLTIGEAAKILNCSPKTLQRRVGGGELPVIRDGRLVRVHPDDLDRFIRQRREL